MRLAALVGVAPCLAIVGCVTTTPPPLLPPPPPPPAATSPAVAPLISPPPVPPAQFNASLDFAQLEGWAEDDHVADFRAFVAGCGAARDPAGAVVCRRALASGDLDEAGARAFLERNFRLEPPTDPGLLTAYFTPVYPARRRADDEFTA